MNIILKSMYVAIVLTIVLGCGRTKSNYQSLLNNPLSRYHNKEYIKESDLLPNNLPAPGMLVKQISDSDSIKVYLIGFTANDDLLSGLQKFASDYNVRSGSISAIGDLKFATFGWWDPIKKAYKKTTISENTELVSLSGHFTINKALLPVMHFHALVTKKDGHSLGGHLLEAIVNPGLNVIVTAYSKPVFVKDHTTVIDFNK